MSTKNTGFQEEKVLKAVSGFGMLFLIVLVMIVSILIPALNSTRPVIGPVLWMIGILLFCIAFVFLFGLKVIHPNEALVLTLFGNYYGTLKHDGFFWVNPFCTAINPTAKQPAEQTAAAGTRSGAAAQSVNKKVSLKTMTLNNEKQKVNDELGNPIEIGTVVIWKVKNATKAVMNVENFKDYLSIQCDAITRNAARRYPYDTSEGGDEKSLRGSSQEVADIMKQELQEKVEDAGISILEVRITHLSYAPEIASAMLQRQQAAAIIDARQKIVEGAVSMVEMALSKLNDTQIVELD